MKQNKHFAELSAQEKKSLNGGCIPEHPFITLGKDGRITINVPDTIFKVN